MSVNDIYVFSNDDITEYREKREDGGERRLSVDDEEGNVVDLKAVGEVAHAMTGLVGMGYYYYFMAAVPEFLGGGVTLVLGEKGGGGGT
jgi:hypothetical protein